MRSRQHIQQIAFRIECSARVRIDDSIALSRPLRGIGSFKLLIARQSVLGHADSTGNHVETKGSCHRSRYIHRAIINFPPSFSSRPDLPYGLHATNAGTLMTSGSEGRKTSVRSRMPSRMVTGMSFSQIVSTWKGARSGAFRQPATRSTSASSNPNSSRKVEIHDNAPSSAVGGLGDFITFGLGMSATEGSLTV
jgi:hypothetical protein